MVDTGMPIHTHLCPGAAFGGMDMSICTRTYPSPPICHLDMPVYRPAMSQPRGIVACTHLFTCPSGLSHFVWDFPICLHEVSASCYVAAWDSLLMCLPCPNTALWQPGHNYAFRLSCPNVVMQQPGLTCSHTCHSQVRPHGGMD